MRLDELISRARNRGLSWTQIGTRLGMGVCQERTGLGLRAIEEAGLTAAVVERAVVAVLPEPKDEVPERIPFSDDAKKVLEPTLRSALRLGHDHVGTEHLLLGLLDQQTGPAARVLAESGLDPAAVEHAVVCLVAENPPA